MQEKTIKKRESISPAIAASEVIKELLRTRRIAIYSITAFVISFAATYFNVWLKMAISGIFIILLMIDVGKAEIKKKYLQQKYNL